MGKEQGEHFGKWTLVVHTTKPYGNTWFATLLFRKLLLYANKHHHLLLYFPLYVSALSMYEHPDNLKES